MPRALEQRRDFVEALRMPRHDHEQRARGERSERIEHQRFLAFARARGEHNAAAGRTLRATRGPFASCARAAPRRT